MRRGFSGSLAAHRCNLNTTACSLRDNHGAGLCKLGTGACVTVVPVHVWQSSLKHSKLVSADTWWLDAVTRQMVEQRLNLGRALTFTLRAGHPISLTREQACCGVSPHRSS